VVHVLHNVGTVGIWKVKLPAQTSPGPHEIQVESSEGFLSFVDVMFGDVWICSGQSNMQFTMREVDVYYRLISSTLYKFLSSIKYNKNRSRTPLTTDIMIISIYQLLLKIQK
jgi:sialate O-acetylesterase